MQKKKPKTFTKKSLPLVTFAFSDNNMLATILTSLESFGKSGRKTVKIPMQYLDQDGNRMELHVKLAKVKSYD